MTQVTQFYLQAMALFVTYPQCPMPKDTLMGHIKNTLDVDWALVA